MQSILDEAFNGGGGLNALSNGTDDDEFPQIMDIEIHPPIEFNGKTYDVLHLQPPTFDQYRAAQFAATPGPTFNTDMHGHLVANVAKVPRQVIGKMPLTDVLRGGNFLERCIENGLRTTKTS